MINVVKLLKDAPKGMKLYSPLFGEVKFKYTNDSKLGIVVEDSEGCCRSFDKYGRYFTTYNNAECLLFPSEDCRTWEEWKLPVKFKFKAGDWLVYKDGGTFCGGLKTIQVETIEKDRYIFTHGTNSSRLFIDSECRPWTVQDAGNGDVLANTAGCVLIVKDNESCLCYIDKNGEFHANNNRWFFANFSDNALMPATKKQRELLLHKMKESGYQWDADKKELRKIKPHYDIKNFHAGIPVLVRDSIYTKWLYTLFGMYNETNVVFPFVVVDMRGYAQCIPYNDDTKHLLGTTDMCPEEYVNW